MHDLMAACQELNKKDVVELWSGDTKFLAVPVAPPSAVAEPAKELPDLNEEDLPVTPDEETFAAMRWASKLGHDSNVLSLIRSLPKEIVDEQVRLYIERDPLAAVGLAKKEAKIHICLPTRMGVRMLVAQRFHRYCQTHGINTLKRLPWGFMQTFIRHNIQWTAQQNPMLRKRIVEWYTTWSSSGSRVLAEVTDEPCQKPTDKSLLKSRAPIQDAKRQRCQGGGRPPKAPLIRQALYEWWSAIRYAIDWTELAAQRRSRGKKNLARFPRSVLATKVHQLIEEHAYASLLNGRPAESFVPNSWWFKRWEEEYGLSMRVANRKYDVPRKTERTPRNLLGQFVQDSAVHHIGLRIRSLDYQLGSVAVPSQRDRGAEQAHLGGTRR